MKLANAPQDVTIPEVFERRNVAVGSTAMILDLFADKIYSHKERAVIRELACNAHDSHVIAGTTDIPFIVHLPTHIEPWFSIRDSGTGLPDEDIANVYGGIGISTKRGSNEVIGCFGVGSLAPYSMADSFVVKSYYNGTLSTYQCMRDDERNPVVIPLSTEPTDEHNGLEITVSVDGRIDQFHSDAIEVFKHWQGTIPQINNKTVNETIAAEKSKFVFEGDDFGLTAEYGSLTAVMGNIAYKVPSALTDHNWNVSGYICFDLGELSFDTSRENLDVSDVNRQAIKIKLNSIKENIKDIAEEKIDKLPNSFEKWQTANAMNFGITGRLLGTQFFDRYKLPELDKKKFNKENNNATFVQYEKTYKTHPVQYDLTALEAVKVRTKMRFFLHKPRFQARIKDSMSGLGRGARWYVFDSVQQAVAVGVPKELLEDLDVLPKLTRVRTSKTASGTRSTHKTFEIQRNIGYSKKDYWKETELELDTGDEIVFVEISRWEAVSGVGSHKIVETLGILKKMGIDVPKVYGLKTAFLKSKAFKANNFVSYQDWVTRTITPIMPKSVDMSRNSRRWSDLENLCSSVESDLELQAIKCAVDSKNSAQTLERMWTQNNLGELPTGTVENCNCDELTQAYYDKYPMLNFVNYFPSPRSNHPENFKAITEYLGLKIKDSV
jgi:hypothetical protein